MSAFTFKSYGFSENTKTATFDYLLENGELFSESYFFDFDFCAYNSEALDRALQLLFFICGVSYYKAYLSPEIVVRDGQIDDLTAEFLNKTYQKGLGELFYKNNLDPNHKISFPVNSSELKAIELNNDGLLVGIGGGKDSLLSWEIIGSSEKTATWSLGHKQQLAPLIDRIGSKHFWVERTIDPKIIELNKKPSVFNGHVPISAIFAAVGTVLSVLSGYKDCLVSNEQSANEMSLEYRGSQINHQYSKSSEFEHSYQNLLNHNFGDSSRYYSLLRPLREIAIAREFAHNYFTKYSHVFSSCNRAFTQDSNQIYWCGQCPKCASTYLLFAPFTPESELVQLFSKNLLTDPGSVVVYKQILGIYGAKPLECVGEIAESRWAMTKMKAEYPILEKFVYEQPKDSTVWNLSDHDIPQDIFVKLEAKFIKISTL